MRQLTSEPQASGSVNTDLDYVLQLRKYVGHQPILIVGATVFALDSRNRLLLLKRTDNHCWGVPGGAVELGEKVEDAARRETRAETEMEIGEMSLFGVFSGPEMYYKYPNGDETYNISIVFLTRDLRGKMNLDPAEHSEHR